jgi:cytochrome P450
MVLDNPDVLQKLQTELESVMPAKNASANLSVLEPLPYLNAVINEGLRLSHGTMHRLSRVHPQNVLKFNDLVIPPNTPVAMTPYFLHMNPNLFPQPRKFDPERWLGKDPKEIERLQKYIGNFGRGSRQCVGMRLAYAEIYLTLGYLFRRLGSELKLFDTQRERDVDYVHDYFIPAPHFNSKGVRVVEA